MSSFRSWISPASSLRGITVHQCEPFHLLDEIDLCSFIRLVPALWLQPVMEMAVSRARASFLWVLEVINVQQLKPLHWWYPDRGLGPRVGHGHGCPVLLHSPTFVITWRAANGAKAERAVLCFVPSYALCGNPNSPSLGRLQDKYRKERRWLRLRSRPAVARRWRGTAALLCRPLLLSVV